MIGIVSIRPKAAELIGVTRRRRRLLSTVVPRLKRIRWALKGTYRKMSVPESAELMASVSSRDLEV